MRMLNKLNDIFSVEEIISINAVPAWEPDGDEDNPSMFVVEAFQYSVDGNETMPLGQYLLDGTKETYQKAVENFNNICVKAATCGWFETGDFKNFKWF